MPSAFQSGAFQEDSFQFETEVPVAVPAAPIGVGSGISGRVFPTKGKFRPPKFNVKVPHLPGAPRVRPVSTKPPRFDPKSVGKPDSDREQLEKRWRAWQASPAAAGMGSASILEFMVWEFLVYKKKLKPGIDFIYQYPLMGGRTRFGGFVADFYFPMRQEVWNPAGLRFHWTTATNRARDIMAKTMLAARGIKLIFIWEDDLMNRPDYALNAAWRGMELPKK